jgi:hypothetical protein
MNNAEIKHKVDEVITELESKGVKYQDHQDGDKVGLGDLVESALTSVGITEDRFKELFNLSECNCSKRKKWLNNLLSWHKNDK